MNVLIRKAAQEDFEAILLLIKEFSIFQKSPQKVTITLDQMINGKDLFNCVVAEYAGQGIIGFATYFFAWYSWSGKTLYLDDLYVCQDYRNRSVGKQLMEAIMEVGRNQFCTKLRWQVSRWNVIAIDYYKKMGAVIEDSELNCAYNLV